MADSINNWAKIFDKEFGDFLFTDVLPNTPVEVKRLKKALRLKKGAQILDLACGVGRHSVELSRQGYQTWGIDVSKDYIDQAVKTASDNKIEQCHFIQDDMLNINKHFENETFDAVICLYNSFGFYEKKRMDKVKHPLKQKIPNRLQIGHHSGNHGSTGGTLNEANR